LAEAEPTLGLVLTRFARTTVPERLYQLLWLGVPFAVDFGLSGHWRAAVWGVAVAALGAWGVADRWLWRAAPGVTWKRRLVRIARATTGALAAGTSALLLIELFLRLLGDGPTF
jgi:hypothetical protein